MLLALAWPMELLPKEKPVLGVVVVWPNGLKRLLLPGCGCGWLNKPPVVVPKPPVAAAAGAAGATIEKISLKHYKWSLIEFCTNNSLLTWCPKGAFVLPKWEAGVWSRWAEQTCAGTGGGCSWAKQTACTCSHWISWALSTRLVVFQSQLLQYKNFKCLIGTISFDSTVRSALEKNVYVKSMVKSNTSIICLTDKKKLLPLSD